MHGACKLLMCDMCWICKKDAIDASSFVKNDARWRQRCSVFGEMCERSKRGET